MVHHLTLSLNRRLQASGLFSPEARLVLDLALPAVGEQMLNMSIGLADTFMVGHLGAQAVAAVGLANTVVLIVTTFFAAVATGVTALVARHNGGGEVSLSQTILHQGYLLGALIGIIFTALGVLLAHPAMRVLQAPADVIGPATGYLQIVALTFALSALMFIGSAALRGAGDTRTPMLVMLGVNVINIGVAYVAIYGMGPIPRMGVAGSAIGAALGRGTGSLIIMAVLLRGRRGLKLRPAGFKIDMLQIRRILNIGLPAGAEQLLLRLGQTIFVVTVAGLGTQVLAAHQLANQAESLSYMPGFGFAVAATTLAGRGLGARDPARASRRCPAGTAHGHADHELHGRALFCLRPTTHRTFC